MRKLFLLNSQSMESYLIVGIRFLGSKVNRGLTGQLAFSGQVSVHS